MSTTSAGASAAAGGLATSAAGGFTTSAAGGLASSAAGGPCLAGLPCPGFSSAGVSCGYAGAAKDTKTKKAAPVTIAPKKAAAPKKPVVRTVSKTVPVKAYCVKSHKRTIQVRSK